MPRRRNIPPDERLKLWVRSGGRCALCKKYLLEGDLTLRPLFLGEAGHIVGQQETEASPRGESALPAAARDLAENLILLCPDCHNEIDKPGALDLITAEWLTKQKAEHETRIRQVTGLDPVRRTAILRMVGDLRSRSVELQAGSVADAVVRVSSRFPRFTLSPDGAGIEIDLRQMPGEASPTADYWRVCRAKIDEVIDHKLVEFCPPRGREALECLRLRAVATPRVPRLETR